MILSCFPSKSKGYPLTVMVFYKLTIHGYIFGKTGRVHHRLLWKESIKLRPRGITVCNWCIQCFSFESLCLPAVSECGFALMKTRTVISKLDNLSESLVVQVMKCLATVVSLPEEMSLKWPWNLSMIRSLVYKDIPHLEQVMRYMRFELWQEMLILLG